MSAGSKSQERPLRILAIDGGGIRGIIPAVLLAEIEKRTKKPISKCFDLIAGTSTGGIIALALCVPGEKRRPRHSAQDLFEFYFDHGPTIFPKKSKLNPRQWIDEKYDNEPLRELLDRYLGNTMLKSALTDVLITSYEIERRIPWFFKSRNAKDKNKHGYDYSMLDVALATSAAPTYFEPHYIGGEHASEYRVLVDGGMVANNPALCAYIEAIESARREKGRPANYRPEVLLVSLGTGEQTRPLRFEEARDWGKGWWAKRVIDIVLDGASDTVDYQLDKILPADRYFRFQVVLDSAKDDLDDATKENMLNLKNSALRCIDEKAHTLESLVPLL